MTVQFCTKCGGEFIKVGEVWQNPKRPYNSATGEPNYLQSWQCKNKKWFFDNHGSGIWTAILKTKE